MPYHLEQSGSGYYVVGPSGRHSKKPLPKRRAILQMRALYANEKAAPCEACAALKGEQIAPGITRIRGNLCNVHGRYGPCDAATGDSSARATIDRNKRINAQAAQAGGRSGGKGRKPRAAAKPKKTEEQRAAEQEEKKRQRDAEREAKRVEADTARRAERDRLLNESGLSNQVRDALVDAAAGDNLAPQNGAELVKLGLAEQGEDGSYRLSPKGRQVVNAANRGDVGSLRDAMGEARDQTARQQRRATERTTRQQQAAQRRQEAEARRASRGAGGSGAKPKKDEPKPAARRVAPRRSAGAGGGSPSSSSSAGNISRRVEQRRRRTEQAEQRNQDAVRRTQERADRERQQTERTRVTTPQLAGAARTFSEGGKVSESDAEALIRNGLARRDRDGTLVLTATGLRATRQKAFAVFKDARGQWRWITRTTTAFEDRDREVISTKALEADVTRADVDGKYGPLRWWHVGEPNPLDKDAPWGPGVDLGMCDFNALSGRTLIESGTFKSEEIARAVASKADQLEVSPGFFHDRRTDPDADGVFHRIYRFERSLVPIWAGRASNLYTGLMVEGVPMDQKKQAALKELGISDETYNSLIGTVEQTEKAADQAGVRYKEADPILAALRAFIGATVKEALEGATVETTTETVTMVEVEEKAAPVEEEIIAETPAVEEQADGAMMDEPMEEEEGGLTLSPEDIAAIGEAVATAIAPHVERLAAAMDVAKAVGGHLEEFKSLVSNYTTTKSAEAVRLERVEAELKEARGQLSELLGDQPAARPTRASQSPDTVINDTALLAAVKASSNGAGPFDDIITNLGLGPQT